MLRDQHNCDLSAVLNSDCIRKGEGVKKIVDPEPITIDPHFSAQFYAELWGISVSTVVRWFQDMDGVLKINVPAKNGKRSRVELRIPWSLGMTVYSERTKSGLN